MKKLTISTLLLAGLLIAACADKARTPPASPGGQPPLSCDEGGPCKPGERPR